MRVARNWFYLVLEGHDQIVLEGDEWLLEVGDALQVGGVEGGHFTPEATLLVAQLVPVGAGQRVVHAGDGVPQVAQSVAGVAHPRRDQGEAGVEVRLHLTHLRLRNLVFQVREVWLLYCFYFLGDIFVVIKGIE